MLQLQVCQRSSSASAQTLGFSERHKTFFAEHYGQFFLTLFNRQRKVPKYRDNILVLPRVSSVRDAETNERCITFGKLPIFMKNPRFFHSHLIHNDFTKKIVKIKRLRYIQSQPWQFASPVRTVLPPVGRKQNTLKVVTVTVVLKRCKSIFKQLAR